MGSAPKADKNMGIAALKSAEVGEETLRWMQGQSEITNGWATQDRDRFQNVFLPLQDQFIADAKSYASPERKEARASEAVADTRLQQRLADGMRKREAMAMGVNPGSGRFAGASAKAAQDGALAAAGAGNLARRAVEQEGDAKMAGAINLGSGLAVNPGTSMSLSNGAIQAGGSAAMQGYGQQGQLLNQDYQNRMQAYQAKQQGVMGVFGALGTLAGMVPGNPFAMLSSKKAKTDKKALNDGEALGAVEKMPVEQWTYKPGQGDGQTHVGPYAEDFHKATGRGDGKSIDLRDLAGVTLGAVRDLAAKVNRLEARAA